MNRFQVIAKPNGKFIVASINESFDEMESRAAAEMACAQLNYEPHPRACETPVRRGRWDEERRVA